MKLLSIDWAPTKQLRASVPAPFISSATLSAVVCAAVALCGLGLAGCSQAPSGQPTMPLPMVKVAQPLVKTVVEWDAYTGRLEAVDLVEIRARVDGYLQSVHFDEGQVVNEGDLLFVIDPRPFEAELNAAKARLQQAQSKLKEAEAMLDEAQAQSSRSDIQLNLTNTNYERTMQLFRRNASSQQDVDEREAEYLQAKADIEAVKASVFSAESAIATSQAEIELAKAGVETAELNLQYTQIRAPITGRTSRQEVTQGNLIAGGTASSSVLTTITSMQPIYCVFDASEQDVLKYMRLAQSGGRESSRVAKNPVFLGLIDEAGFPHRGHMDFVDNRFDTNTASMRARCVFANEDQLLLPGMFARIRIPGSAAQRTILIPDSAIGTDQSSQYVFAVVDGVIQRRAIETGPIVDGLRVIRSGLTGSETIVIEGLLQSRPEAKVNVVQGTFEAVEDGLPDDYQPVPEDEWISPEPDPLPTTHPLPSPDPQRPADSLPSTNESGTGDQAHTIKGSRAAATGDQHALQAGIGVATR